MEFVQNLVLVIHLLGMAAIIGSAIFTARGRVTPALLWGARAQLLTGLILVGLAQMNHDQVNNAKVAVKFVVALAVAACAEIAAAKEKRNRPVPANLVSGAGWLAVLNVAVAALWTAES